MQNRRLIIGSRSSKLALIQAELVKKQLQSTHPGLDIEIRTIKTTGDKILDVALSKIGNKDLFTKEIDQALLRKEIDLAVHSMKDIPTQIPKGLEIAAIMKREDPCDILVSLQPFDFKTLPKNSRVGTSSLRRQAQALNIRDDLQILDLRGNLDTRIRKLNEGLFDAIILAYAGVKRLGLSLNMSIIPIDDILPQAGQGALGIETRESDDEVCDLIKELDDYDSRCCIEAERSLLSSLGGGCHAPVGVCASVEGDQIIIKGGVFSLDGKRAIKDEIVGNQDNAVKLGTQLADKLRDEGAGEILAEVSGG